MPPIAKVSFEPFVMLPEARTTPNIKIPEIAKKYLHLPNCLKFFEINGTTSAITSETATIINCRIDFVRDILVRITKLIESNIAV